MKPSLTIVRTLAAVTAILVLSLARRADAQVVNGGFETGDFTGWTVNDTTGPLGTGFTNVNSFPDTIISHSGNYHANLGAEGGFGTLSQNVATVAGDNYQLTFWMANDSSALTEEFNAFWNGNEILNLVQQPIQNYTQYSFTVSATSSSTPLEFQYRNDDDFFRLDDVSATVVSVPEPTTVSLLLLAAAAAVPVLRKRRK